MRVVMSAVALGALIVCGDVAAQDRGHAGNLAPGGGSKEQSRPQTISQRPGAPVESSPKNVPDFQPAFSGQTRVPALKTRAAFQITEIAPGF